MSAPKVAKPKTLMLSKDQTAELSYISMNRTSAMEVANFWDKRMDRFMLGVRKALSIGDDHNVDWGKAFTDGTIEVTKAPPKAVVNPTEQKPEPKKEDHDSDSKNV